MRGDSSESSCKRTSDRLKITRQCHDMLCEKIAGCRELPPSVEEGWREAPEWCWLKDSILEQHHPSRGYASAFPSSTEEGSFPLLRLFVQSCLKEIRILIPRSASSCGRTNSGHFDEGI